MSETTISQLLNTHIPDRDNVLRILLGGTFIMKVEDGERRAGHEEGYFGTNEYEEIRNRHKSGSVTDWDGVSLDTFASLSSGEFDGIDLDSNEVGDYYILLPALSAVVAQNIAGHLEHLIQKYETQGEVPVAELPVIYGSMGTDKADIIFSLISSFIQDTVVRAVYTAANHYIGHPQSDVEDHTEQVGQVLTEILEGHIPLGSSVFVFEKYIAFSNLSKGFYNMGTDKADGIEDKNRPVGAFHKVSGTFNAVGMTIKSLLEKEPYYEKDATVPIEEVRESQKYFAHLASEAGFCQLSEYSGKVFDISTEKLKLPTEDHRIIIYRGTGDGNESLRMGEHLINTLRKLDQAYIIIGSTVPITTISEPGDEPYENSLIVQLNNAGLGDRVISAGRWHQEIKPQVLRYLMETDGKLLHESPTVEIRDHLQNFLKNRYVALEKTF